MTIALILSTLIGRKQSVDKISKKDWRCAIFYLIHLIYGGAFLIMLIA